MLVWWRSLRARAPGCDRCAFSSSWAAQRLNSPHNAGMVSRRRGRTEEALPRVPAAAIAPATGPRIMLLLCSIRPPRRRSAEIPQIARGLPCRRFVCFLSPPRAWFGHQSLLMKLPKTGGGAAFGRRGAFQGRLGRSARTREQRQQGQDACVDAAHGRRHGRKKAQLWINHDKAQRDGLKMSPAFYD